MVLGEITLSAIIPAWLVLKVLTKKREKRYKNSYLIKNLFKEADFIDFLDRNITSKKMNDDFEYIGWNIDKKTFTVIKMYLSLIIPILYVLITFIIIHEVDLKRLALYAFSMFTMILLLSDILVRYMVKFTQQNLRFEFINLLGAWSRNIELGSNFIAALEKSCEIVSGSLKKYSYQLVKDIHASTPLDAAIINFGHLCRDKEILEFCDSMASDVKDGADISKYITDTNKRIQNDKANIINSNTKLWEHLLSSITGILIFFSFAVYLILKTNEAL